MFPVSCPSLPNPDNGMISCLEDDGSTAGSGPDSGTLFYEDTCNFTCNTGYELTGSDIRTCQSDGSWSGTETMCMRGNM